MMLRFTYIAIILLVQLSLLNAQPDVDPPVSPVIDLVSVDHSTGYVSISWIRSPSTDVSAYVIYLFKNGRGFDIDTIYDPSADSYIYTGSGSRYFSESFVVAAVDTAGNISPLSLPPLNTIHVSARIDTCNKTITVSWNGYPSVPRQVLGYSLFASVNGEPFSELAQAEPGKESLTVNDFYVDSEYIFFVRASLTGGSFSGSNETPINTKMQRPPGWINADYATVTPENEIQLSFTIDPLSEISSYVLEKKTGSSGDFSALYTINSSGKKLLYSDNKADISMVNTYRLRALNNCNNTTTISNITSNIVLMAEKNENEIVLRWNKYREWTGINDSYILFINTGSSFSERYSLPGNDTTFTIPYSSLMYEVSLKGICFIIKAMEGINPYGDNGMSSSCQACIQVTERITVPTIFTPDNNSLNDLFAPSLSFTPLSYKLVITDKKRRVVFETGNFSESWDGSLNGQLQPEGVYLWFLNVRTPSGQEIVRTGTVTLIHGR